MDIVHIAAKRHTVKSFDQQRRIPDAAMMRIPDDGDVRAGYRNLLVEHV